MCTMLIGGVSMNELGMSDGMLGTDGLPGVSPVSEAVASETTGAINVSLSVSAGGDGSVSSVTGAASDSGLKGTLQSIIGEYTPITVELTGADSPQTLVLPDIPYICSAVLLIVLVLSVTRFLGAVVSSCLR